MDDAAYPPLDDAAYESGMDDLLALFSQPLPPLRAPAPKPTVAKAPSPAPQWTMAQLVRVAEAAVTRDEFAAAVAPPAGVVTPAPMPTPPALRPTVANYIEAVVTFPALMPTVGKAVVPPAPKPREAKAEAVATSMLEAAPLTPPWEEPASAPVLEPAAPAAAPPWRPAAAPPRKPAAVPPWKPAAVPPWTSAAVSVGSSSSGSRTAAAVPPWTWDLQEACCNATRTAAAGQPTLPTPPPAPTRKRPVPLASAPPPAIAKQSSEASTEYDEWIQWWRCVQCGAELLEEEDWCYSGGHWGRPRVKRRTPGESTRMRGDRGGRQVTPKFHAARDAAEARGELQEFLARNTKPRNRHEDSVFRES